MDYGSLIRDAWLTTWRNRFLWVLGLFAGVTIGSLALGGSSLTVQVPPVDQLLVIGLIGVALTLVSVIARGGMTQATLAVETGGTISAMAALKAGLRSFWRFLLLLCLVGLLAGVIGGAAWLATASLGQVGAMLAAVALTFGAAFSIVLAYAERAIVVHDLGPLQAVRHGWRMFVGHPSTSLLAWLLSVVLAFGMAELVALLLSSLTQIAGIVLLVASAAIANAFFWSYWTLAYLRLEAPPPSTA